MNRAMVQAESPQDHGRRVKAESQQKQEIINPVILPESLAPEEDRINHANAVNNNG
jgi:hypothetical protein